MLAKVQKETLKRVTVTASGKRVVEDRDEK